MKRFRKTSYRSSSKNYCTSDYQLTNRHEQYLNGNGDGNGHVVRKFYEPERYFCSRVIPGSAQLAEILIPVGKIVHLLSRYFETYYFIARLEYVSRERPGEDLVRFNIILEPCDYRFV